MTTFTLPLSACTKLIGPGLVAWSAALVLACRIDLSWRIAAASLVMLSGTWLWMSFLKCRPVSLSIATGGAISCTRADGQVIEVSRVLPGIIRPGLVCARLEAEPGCRCDLLVPGGALPEAAHWQLRRALTRFRPVHSNQRRGT